MNIGELLVNVITVLLFYFFISRTFTLRRLHWICRGIGLMLLFVLIMCVTLFQAQKSYNESIKERDDKIALQEQYTAEILAQQTELDEKNSQLSSQDEQLDKQKKLLAELAAQLKEQQATLDKQQTDLDEKTSLLATQQKKIDNIIGVKADVIEALQKEFSKNNVSVDIDSQTGALTLNASVADGRFGHGDAHLLRPVRLLPDRQRPAGEPAQDGPLHQPDHGGAGGNPADLL